MTAIAEYNPLEAGLADLRHRFENVVFDVTTTRGDKEARAARLELVRLRSSLEEKRVELKAPALERSRLIDTEAKRIKEEILKLEQPIDAAIKAEEQRKECERQAKIEAERKRIADIQERIVELRGHPSLPMQSALIAEHIADLEKIEIDDTFAEFRPVAEKAKADGIARLKAQHAEALAREAEAERLAAEAARLAAERARLEEERRAEEARIAEARRIENERIAEERRIAREAAEAEEAERRRLQKVEDDRLAEIRRQAQAEHEARMAEERRAAEEERQRLAAVAAEQQRKAAEAEAAERAKREAEEAARREEARRHAEAVAAAAADQQAAVGEALDLVREIATSTEQMKPAWVTKIVERARAIVARMDAETEERIAA